MAGGHNDIENWFEASVLLPRLLGGYPWGKLYSVFLLVFQAMNAFVYSSVAIPTQLHYLSSGFLGLTITHVLFYGLEIFSVICVVTGGLLKEEVGRCLDGLMTVKISLRALGLEAEKKSTKYIGFDWTIAALFVCRATLTTVIFENRFLNFYPTFIGVDVALIIVYGRLCVFLLLLGAVEEQLDRLVHGTSKKTVSRVECLAEQAEILCSLTERIHSAFTPFTALALSFYFMCAVVSAYYFCSGIETSNTNSLSYAFVSASLNFVVILRAVSCCVAVKNKVFGHHYLPDLI